MYNLIVARLDLYVREVNWVKLGHEVFANNQRKQGGASTRAKGRVESTSKEEE